MNRSARVLCGATGLAMLVLPLTPALAEPGYPPSGPTGSGQPVTSTPGAPVGSGLPTTGSELAEQVAVGVASTLVGAGLLFVVGAKRRYHPTH